MSHEFNCDLEDNSQVEIASLLCQCYEKFLNNQKSELIKMIKQAPIAAVTQCESAPNQNGDDYPSSDEDDAMECEVSIGRSLRSCNISTSTITEENDDDKNETPADEDSEWTQVSSRTRSKTKKKESSFAS